ncbi:hypothetical protein BaRGS_00017535 [Batillaria attramentaria]|uniref:Uncharacterized protein n=1 Tax=Batillaria attramentaria TaxID=370345 RepID=A0ABD0KVL6_9CAEN
MCPPDSPFHRTIPDLPVEMDPGPQKSIAAKSHGAAAWLRAASNQWQHPSLLISSATFSLPAFSFPRAGFP